MSDDVFEQRCQNNPQGVIKDLIAQTSRQGGEIHKLMELTDAVLLPKEATHLINLLKSQPASVSRDFAVEDLEEQILKRLEKIVKVSKVKKK